MKLNPDKLIDTYITKYKELNIDKEKLYQIVDYSLYSYDKNCGLDIEIYIRMNLYFELINEIIKSDNKYKNDIINKYMTLVLHNTNYIKKYLSEEEIQILSEDAIKEVIDKYDKKEVFSYYFIREFKNYFINYINKTYDKKIAMEEMSMSSIEYMANMPLKREPKQEKKVSKTIPKNDESLYKYFSNYNESQINEVLLFTTDLVKQVFQKKWGNNYDKKIDSNLTSSERITFSRGLALFEEKLEKISKNIKLEEVKQSNKKTIVKQEEKSINNTQLKESHIKLEEKSGNNVNINDVKSPKDSEIDKLLIEKKPLVIKERQLEEELSVEQLKISDQSEKKLLEFYLDTITDLQLATIMFLKIEKQASIDSISKMFNVSENIIREKIINGLEEFKNNLIVLIDKKEIEYIKK